MPPAPDPGPDHEPDPACAALVLTGGTAARLGGADKAGLSHEGRRFLDRALAAVEGLEVVVVGDPVADVSDVRFVRESPPGGGPGAGLLAGLDALDPSVEAVVVLAVDMPLVTTSTVARLRSAYAGDGVLLVDGDGRRQYLCGVYRVASLRAAAPPPGERDGLPVRRLLAGLDLAELAAAGGEAHDVDTWPDLDALATVASRSVATRSVASGTESRQHGRVNLHDWIDELCDALDIEVEVDEALVLDLARDAAHQVDRPAAPITTFLLGYAAAKADGDVAEVERLAGIATALAQRWDKTADDLAHEDDDVTSVDTE